MSHDLHANWASSELAHLFKADPLAAFQAVPSYQFDTYATRDASGTWPHADGVVQIHRASGGSDSFAVAVEFKRENEGVHGILTGMGQSQSYIAKGFAGSALVLPASYSTLSDSGRFVKSVLKKTFPHAPVGVFTYHPPNLASARPFENRIQVVEAVRLGAVPPTAMEWTTRVKSQWVHVREGSVFPDSVYRYLMAARQCSSGSRHSQPKILRPLEAAAKRIAAKSVPAKYLSYTVGESLQDRTWRSFWFGSVLTKNVQAIWSRKTPNYLVANIPTNLVQWDGSPVIFFSPRRDSPKQKLVEQLNAKVISETQAWEMFAQNVHNRAHSLREDIDSFVEPAGLVDAEGRLTALGNEFVDACQRANDANAPGPLAIFRRAYLLEGDALSLLHYIHRLSTDAFSADPLKYVSGPKAPLRFDRESYLAWLRDEMSLNLKVMATSTLRGGIERKPFQGELAILRKLDLCGSMRPGVGLDINWPMVHETLTSS